MPKDNINNIEKEAIELVSRTIAEMPKDNIKSITLYWECISSDYLPHLSVVYKNDQETPSGGQLG